jgi:hypothetical protein
MNAAHPHIVTDWQGVAMSLADVITELHPNYAPEVLAVISHHTSAILNTTTLAASAEVNEALAA